MPKHHSSAMCANRCADIAIHKPESPKSLGCSATAELEAPLHLQASLPRPLYRRRRGGAGIDFA